MQTQDVFNLHHPVPGGKLSSPFGARGNGRHGGVDFAVPTGTTVEAAAEGKVIRAADNEGYGKVIVIDHGNGNATLYAHLLSYSVVSGQRVTLGQEIGKSGNTGSRSQGPHLHFELLKLPPGITVSPNEGPLGIVPADYSVNPMPYILDPTQPLITKEWVEAVVDVLPKEGVDALKGLFKSKASEPPKPTALPQPVRREPPHESPSVPEIPQEERSSLGRMERELREPKEHREVETREVRGVSEKKEPLEKKEPRVIP